MKNIAIILGGTSSERKISLMSGKAVYKAIQRLAGFRPIKYDAKTDLEKLAKDKEKIDLVFIALHGAGGEDGEIQKYLEKLNLPYTGSDPKASSIAFDKVKAKQIFRQNGIDVLPHFVLTQGSQIPKNIQYPIVIKPKNGGSSIGIAIAKNFNELLQKLPIGFKCCRKVILEKCIIGRELTVPVLGNGKNAKALPVVEIVPTKGEFFDYENKYDGSTREITPAKLNKTQTEKAQNIALRAHNALGCRGLTRTDMILLDGKFFVLELNIIPGLTDQSLAPKSAKAMGMDFKELIKKIINEVHSL